MQAVYPLASHIICLAQTDSAEKAAALLNPLLEAALLPDHDEDLYDAILACVMTQRTDFILEHYQQLLQRYQMDDNLLVAVLYAMQKASMHREQEDFYYHQLLEYMTTASKQEAADYQQRTLALYDDIRADKQPYICFLPRYESLCDFLCQPND